MVDARRPEDSKITGYDARGKARTWLTKDLPGGKLPAGYSDKPPEGTHPNDPDRASPNDAERAAELDRREAELAEREAKLAESNKGAGGKQK